MIYGLSKRVLFRLDAEKAHELVTEQMIRVQSHPLLLGAVARLYGSPERPVDAFGFRFSNPLGIAAGFDKNALLVPMLAALGFGFVEVGTVTLRPQPGNEKPRLFRDPRSRALINRLGFNNAGAAAMAKSLETLRTGAAASKLPPLFVNIGKNRDVPVEEAVSAYRDCYRIVAPFADAVVVNVSSPNTPGLRDLQRAESLREIVETLRSERVKIRAPRGAAQPIIVKISPDMTAEQLDEVATTCAQLADGITATNTTLARDRWTQAPQNGGLSGAPLFERSTEVLRALKQRLPENFPLIGVGGIFTATDVREKLAAGATLVQAYTGFIYEGPAFASRIVRGLRRNSAA